jgi:hypothetical protein
MQPFVSISRRSSASWRCAYCHDSLGNEWDACTGCNTRLHPECRTHAIECPTLGCRMSVLRAGWSQSRLRPRPAFRRALARMAERHESSRYARSTGSEDRASEERPCAWPPWLFVAHLLLSPLALVAFSVYFAAIYAPLHWIARFTRSPALARAARDSSRAAGTVFSFETAFAPFVVLAGVGLAAMLGASGAGAPFVLAAVLGIASLFLVPPAVDWSPEAEDRLDLAGPPPRLTAPLPPTPGFKRGS